MEPKIDIRIQGLPHAAVEQDEDDRIPLIGSLVRPVKNHPNEDGLIAHRQNNRTYNAFSEEPKKMIHNMGNVECFELCEIFLKIQCSYSSKYWTEGLVYCTCGTCLIHTEYMRRLTKKKFDALTMPYFVIEKGTRHRVCYGRNEAQREYRQAKDC